MGKLDIAIIVLVTLAGLKCFRAGFTRSVWGIAAISAGVFTASQLWRDLAPFLQRWIQHESLAKWASVIAITAVVSIVMDVVFERVQKVVDRGVLGWINSAVGGVFGVIVSCVMLATVLILVNRFGGDSLQATIADSRFGPALLDIGHQVFDFGKEVIKEKSSKL